MGVRAAPTMTTSSGDMTIDYINWSECLGPAAAAPGGSELSAASYSLKTRLTRRAQHSACVERVGPRQAGKSRKVAVCRTERRAVFDRNGCQRRIHDKWT